MQYGRTVQSAPAMNAAHASKKEPCIVISSSSDIYRKWNWKNDLINYTFKPGTTKTQACEVVFNWHQTGFSINRF